MAVVSVFVSSTFRDFHAERDVLIESVRKRLDERLQPLGCRVEIVDLRWGVAVGDPELDREARQRRVLDVCLSEIARSRPLFVGLIGDRYGWVPPVQRALRVAAEAGLDVEVAGRSVTELEFLHGALQQVEVVTPVFFLRELTGDAPDGWRDTDPEQVETLEMLRQRVRDHSHVLVHEYAAAADGQRIIDLSEFEQLAVDVLGPLVEARARELTAAADDENPADAPERLFVTEHTAVVVGRDGLLDQVTAAVQAGQSVCLTGPSGVGKSALWCTVVQRLRVAGVTVAAVPVGAAPGVTSERMVLARLAAQLDATIPAELFSTEQLRDWWCDLLAGRAPVVVAVDGLDSLDAGAAREELGFLTGLPDGVTRLASTTREAQAELLARTGVEAKPVTDLPAAAVSDVVAALLQKAGRELPVETFDVLASRDRSPLWLTLAVGELNALDEDDFAQVDPGADPLEELARLITHTVTSMPQDVEGLISEIAGRAERRFGSESVTAMLQPLLVSRSGLAPADLVALTGLGDVIIAGVRRAFAGLIETCGAAGRLSFVHSIAHHTLEQRYLRSDISLRRQQHAGIARYLQTIPQHDPVGEDDLLWHAMHSDGEPSAAPILNGVPFTAILKEGADAIAPIQRAVRIVSAALSDEAIDVERVTRGLQRDGLLVLLATLNTVACDVKADRLQHLSTTALKNARRLFQAFPDSVYAARDYGRALRLAGDVAEFCGEGKTASVLYKASLGVARSTVGERPDFVGMAMDSSQAFMNLGSRALAEGNETRARALFEKSLKLRRRLHEWVNRPDVSAPARLKHGITSNLIATLLAVCNVSGDSAVESMRTAGDRRRVMLAYAKIERAGEYSREALKIAMARWDLDPGDIGSARDVIRALAHYAGWSWLWGSRESSYELIAEGLKVARCLLDKYPSDRPTMYAAADSMTAMARLELSRGQANKARELCDEAVRLTCQMLDSATNRARHADEVGVLARGLLVGADVARMQRNPNDEFWLLRRVINTLAQFSIDVPQVGHLKDDVRRRLEVLATSSPSLELAAACASALQELGETPSLIVDIVQKRRDAYAASPEVLRLGLKLVAALLRLAEITPKHRRSRVYHDALEVSRALRTDHPSSQQCLASVLARQGRLSQELGNDIQARKFFEESVLTARKLVSTVGADNLQAARTLAQSLSFLWTCDRNISSASEAALLIEGAQIVSCFAASEFPDRDALRARLLELGTALSDRDAVLAGKCRVAAEAL